MRTAGLVVVAAAISAAAGAAVVFSLVSQPVTEGSVAARTLAQPTDTIPAPVRMSVMLPAELGPATDPVGSDPSRISTMERAAGAAAVAPAITDAPPARADNKAATMGDGTPTQKADQESAAYIRASRATPTIRSIQPTRPKRLLLVAGRILEDSTAPRSAGSYQSGTLQRLHRTPRPQAP
jgi:hypothetical protein